MKIPCIPVEAPVVESDWANLMAKVFDTYCITCSKMNTFECPAPSYIEYCAEKYFPEEYKSLVEKQEF